MFLEKCKYIVNEKKISKYTSDDLKTSSDDSDEGTSDEKQVDDKSTYK